MQVKSSLSAKSKSKSKSSSLKESTGASNIHPLIDMSKLLQSQVREERKSTCLCTSNRRLHSSTFLI